MCLNVLSSFCNANTAVGVMWKTLEKMWPYGYTCVSCIHCMYMHMRNRVQLQSPRRPPAESLVWGLGSGVTSVLCSNIYPYAGTAANSRRHAPAHDELRVLRSLIRPCM